MSTTLSVPGGFKELGIDHGFEEGSDDNGPWARKPYLVDWADRTLFVQQLRGTSSMTGGSGSKWIRAIPYQYPDENFNIFCTSANIKGEGKLLTTTPISYTNAIITAMFRPLTWAGNDPFGLSNIDPGTPIPFADQEIDILVEGQELPNSAVLYNTSRKFCTIHLLQEHVIIKMLITWHQYPVLPMALAQAYANSVNDNTFLGCAKGTVKFMGPKTVRKMSADGNIVQQVAFEFKWRHQDWNMMPLPDGLGYDYIVSASGSGPVYRYPYLDYSQLLLPGVSA